MTSDLACPMPGPDFDSYSGPPGSAPEVRSNAAAASVELWDENKLRSLLITPEATYVRRAYYELPSGSDAGEPLAPSASWSVTSAVSWQGGAEYELGRGRR
jgi:hypothetical protein